MEGSPQLWIIVWNIPSISIYGISPKAPMILVFLFFKDYVFILTTRPDFEHSTPIISPLHLLNNNNIYALIHIVGGGLWISLY